MDTSAIIAALRDRAKKLVSLDTPQDQDLGDVAVDVAAGFAPGIGTMQSARDLERARREGDGLGMGLAAVGLVPFVGGVTKGIGALRKGSKYPRAGALESARENAVKMLGLPANNTAMDRARALGFDTEAFHGTGADFPKFDGQGIAGWFSSDPRLASAYANEAKRTPDHAANVIPTVIRNTDRHLQLRGDMNDVARPSDVFVKGREIPLPQDMDSTPRRMYQIVNDKEFINAVRNAGYEGVTAREAGRNTFGTFNPANVRSRFAAFDPARVNENDLLGRATVPMMATLAAGSAGTAATVAALRDKKKDKKETDKNP